MAKVLVDLLDIYTINNVHKKKSNTHVCVQDCNSKLIGWISVPGPSGRSLPATQYRVCTQLLSGVKVQCEGILQVLYCLCETGWVWWWNSGFCTKWSLTSDVMVDSQTNPALVILLSQPLHVMYVQIPLPPTKHWIYIYKFRYWVLTVNCSHEYWYTLHVQSCSYVCGCVGKVY